MLLCFIGDTEVMIRFVVIGFVCVADARLLLYAWCRMNRVYLTYPYIRPSLLFISSLFFPVGITALPRNRCVLCRMKLHYRLIEPPFLVFLIHLLLFTLIAEACFQGETKRHLPSYFLRCEHLDVSHRCLAGYRQTLSFYRYRYIFFLCRHNRPSVKKDKDIKRHRCRSPWRKLTHASLVAAGSIASL